MQKQSQTHGREVGAQAMTPTPSPHTQAASGLFLRNIYDTASRWKEASLAKRAKGERGMVKIAARLREETLVTLKWIATELQMGTWTHVANRLSVSPTQADHQPDLNLCQK